MNYKKAIGLGLLDWAIMFAVVSAVLPIYNQFAWMKFVIAIVSGVVAYGLAGYAKLSNPHTALAYSSAWVLIGVLLDALITMRFNPNIFHIWSLWLGYFLTLIAPIAYTELRKK